MQPLLTEDIFRKIRETYKEVKIPSGFEFALDKEGVLSVKIKKEGPISNMQKNSGAFDSWILIIMTLLKDKFNINKIKLEWDIPKLENDSDKKHYNRFLYRLIKLKNMINVEIDKKNENEVRNFGQETQLYMNWPNSNGKEIAAKVGEAHVERLFKETKEWTRNFDVYDHQLPVGVFEYENTKRKFLFEGQKSAIDLWGVNGSKLNIFELKYNNKCVGIISELLFYMWLMEDLFKNEKIQYPDESKIKRESFEVRNFDKIYSAYKNRNIGEVIGTLLADKYHPLVNNNLVKYIQDCFDGKEMKHMQIMLKEYRYGEDKIKYPYSKINPANK